jgi:glucose-6-phosphate isomerase
MNIDYKSKSWKSLKRQAETMQDMHLNDLFSNDLQRFEKFSLEVGDILFDYSKNLITDDIMAELIDLVKESDIEGWREKMYSGGCVNMTENRPVLHVALREGAQKKPYHRETEIAAAVEAEIQKLKSFVNQIRSGQWCGYSGKKITDVVNIGIGGSNLGPQMVTEALHNQSDGKIKVHYVSNVDSAQIAKVLRPLNPEEVLFVVASKTFTTKETLTNAGTALNWLLASSFDATAIEKHFIGVTAKAENALDFGLPEENIFKLWDWVGGRFSLWSAIGLPIALYLGFEVFEELLEGASSMDQHFYEAPPEKNAPIILGLIGIWNSTFMGAQAQAILPYNQSLHMFADYLQQAEMESNGKSVDWDGNEVSYSTGSILWGQLGIDGQHAFYQYLHQGKNIVPADFIGVVENTATVKGHHEYLMANFFAQTQALMTGIDEEQVRLELRAKGKSEQYINRLVSHKVHKGNRPTNSILLDGLTPHSLGALIALYEHKIFVQGIIWRVCSFDQWGVELGKELAGKILPQLEPQALIEAQDSSTVGLINHYKKIRER